MALLRGGYQVYTAKHLCSSFFPPSLSSSTVWMMKPLLMFCLSPSSQRVMNRKQTLGKPDQRDLNENLAATHGLAHMIQECRKLFRVSSLQRSNSLRPS